MPRDTFSEMTRAQLDNLADRLEVASRNLRGLASAMGKQGIDSLSIKHHDLMLRSIKGIESYSKVAWDAHHDTLEALGHYGPKKQRKKKKKP